MTRQVWRVIVAPPTPYIISAPTIWETPNMETHVLSEVSKDNLDERAGNVRHPNRMLSSTIPVADDDHKRWAHRALEKAEEKPNSPYATETLRCSETHFSGAP